MYQARARWKRSTRFPQNLSLCVRDFAEFDDNGWFFTMVIPSLHQPAFSFHPFDAADHILLHCVCDVVVRWA